MYPSAIFMSRLYFQGFFPLLPHGTSIGGSIARKQLSIAQDDPRQNGRIFTVFLPRRRARPCRWVGHDIARANSRRPWRLWHTLRTDSARRSWAFMRWQATASRYQARPIAATSFNGDGIANGQLFLVFPLLVGQRFRDGLRRHVSPPKALFLRAAAARAIPASRSAATPNATAAQFTSLSPCKSTSPRSG